MIRHTVMRAAPARAALIVLALCLLLVGAMSGGSGRSLAQEGAATPATPVPLADFEQLVAQRPVAIHAGSCDEPGETIAVLTPLATAAGEVVGQGAAIEAERSYTILPIPVEALFAGQASVSAYLSDAESDLTIVCGEIGGVPSDGGSLVVKLSERNGSGFTGIAFLAPGDPGASAASVFLAGNRTVAETRDLVAATPDPALAFAPIPEPTPTAELVQVYDIVLLEWMIDIPAEIRAGQVSFAVSNEGAEPHSLVIESGGVLVAELANPLDPGESSVLTGTLAPGEYVVYCPLGDGAHRSEGMETSLVVVP